MTTMTKAHEQTWQIVDGECGPELDLGEDSGGFSIVNKGMWGTGQMELARAAPELARVLIHALDVLGESHHTEYVEITEQARSALRAAGVLP